MPSGEQDTFESLVQQFWERFRCQAAIVGPHGSGKSTLMSHICRELTGGKLPLLSCHPNSGVQCGDPDGTVIHVQLRRGHRPWHQWLCCRRYWNPGRFLVVDGLEQLPWWARSWIGYEVRRRRMPILASSHRRISWLPTLLQTQVSTDLALRIVRRLLPDSEHEELPHLLDPNRLEALLRLHRGNFREVLMSLYDDYQVGPASSRVGWFCN